MDEILSIDPSVNVFTFRDFNIHHKDCLTYSGGTDRLGEFQTTLIRWLTFLLGSQAVILTVLYFWISFFLLMLVFDLQWLSLPSDHVVASVSIDFPPNLQRDASFHWTGYDYPRPDWDGLRDHLRDVSWEDISKLSAPAADSEFCEWLQVGINVYIPHRKYKVKPNSSSWFSAACTTVIDHRNHFFVCTNRINLLNIK